MFRKAFSVIFFTMLSSLAFAQNPAFDSTLKSNTLPDSFQVKEKYQFISDNAYEDTLIKLFSSGIGITLQNMDDAIIRNWGDILNLRKETGVINYSNPEQPQILQMNGSIGQIGILEDGFKYASPLFHFPYIGGLDLSYLPMENVGQVEVINSGLGGVLDDDGSLGILKIKSKEFEGDKAFSKALYQKAPYDFHRTQLELGKNFTSRGKIYLTAGFKGYGGYLQNNSSESMHLTFSGEYIPRRNWNLGINLLSFTGKRGLPYTNDFSLKPIKEYGDDWMANLKLIHKSSPNSLSKFNLSYRRTKQRFNNSNFRIFRQDVEQLLDLEAEHQLIVKKEHNFSLKGELKYNQLKQQSATDNIQKGSASITDLFKPKGKLSFLFFARLNYMSHFNAGLSSMAGANYKISNESSLFFTLGSFSGFPSIRDLYTDSVSYDLSSSPQEDAFTIQGKRDLPSQRSLAANLGYSLKKENYKLGLNFNRNRLENAVIWKNGNESSLLGNWIPQNRDLNLYGANLDAELILKKNIKMFISYGFQKAENVHTHFDNSLVPEHSVFGYIEYHKRCLKNEIEFGGRVENNYVSGYYVADEEKEKQNDWDILNLRFTFKFLDFTCYYVIENANNAGYKTFLNYPAPGRTHWWGFSWQFFN